MYEELFQRIKMSDFPIECRAAMLLPNINTNRLVP